VRAAILGGALLVLALAPARAAWCNTELGTLAAAASAANYYQVTCFDDGRGAPASLAVAVRDLAPVAAPLLSVQIQRQIGLSYFAATNATDPTDGDAAFSPQVAVNAGAGVYDVFVDKTGAGEESFTLRFQCSIGADGGGAPTGTSIFPSAPPEVPLLPPPAWLALAALLAALAPLRGASAHTLNESLGADASGTDFFQILCSNDGAGPPQSLAVQVRDNPPVAALQLSVQVQRGTQLVNSSDPNDGDTAASPLVTVNGDGTAFFDVLVDKTGAGGESYTLTFHCMTGPNGTGQHTGTSILIRKDDDP
jgi:hypothetical protein